MRSEALLINPPMWSPSEHQSFSALCPPLGLGYLAASLLRNGIPVRILDLNVSQDPGGELQAALTRLTPRFVGVTALTQNYALARQVARTVKAAHGDVFLAIGGPHASYEWRQAMADPAFDCVVFFEGEQTIVELCRQLENPDPDMSGIRGIAYREGNRVVRTAPRPYERRLDSIPYPARQLLPMARYRRPGTIMTSRGCPEKCIFCISSTYEGAYRMRSPANVVDELAMLKDTWGIREIYFLDNVFTVNTGRVYEICRQIADRGLDIQFHCVSRANLLTEDNVRWLKGAGCQRIEIGVESGAQELIDAFRKHIRLEDVERAVDLVLGAGLQPMFTFQIGSPFETEETLEKTHHLAASLRARGAITFFSIMTPYPGTPLVEQAEHLGLKIRSNDWREYRTSNPVYDTPHLDRNAFRRALYRESVAMLAPAGNGAAHDEGAAA